MCLLAVVIAAAAGEVLVPLAAGLLVRARSEPLAARLQPGMAKISTLALGVLVLATILGVVIGVARLSTNWLVRRTAGIYVEGLRNVPPLVLIVFFYLGVISRMPEISVAIEPGGLVVMSNRGIWVPWIAIDEGATVFVLLLLAAVAVAAIAGRWRTRRHDLTGEPHHRLLWGVAVFIVIAFGAWLMLDRPAGLTVPVRDGRSVDGGALLFPEYGALLIALVLYTSAFIAEIVRGSIQAVPKGQLEAANALGLSWFGRLRFVVLPQALRIATPPTGNEALNLSKNVSLGLAIAFPELLRAARIAIGNGFPAPQLVLLALIGYLLLSLVLSAITNVINRRLQLVER